MKNKLLTVILVVFMIVSLAGCGGDLNTDGDNNISASGYLYAPGTTLKIIYPDNGLYDYANELLYAMSANMTTVPSMATDKDSEASGSELVIGATSREVSKKAYEHLADLESDNEYEIPYLVYSDGKSVAIAYTQDDNGYNVALIKAIEAFIDHVGRSESFGINEGSILAGFVEPLEYQEAIDAEMMLSKWDNVAVAIRTKLQSSPGPFKDRNGKEVSRDEYINLVVASLKDLYSIYSDDVISWFANLYEPNGGGYYFSNSARNTC